MNGPSAARRRRPRRSGMSSCGSRDIELVLRLGIAAKRGLERNMGIGVMTMVPALHALPTELASTMLLREQQLKSILTALRSSGVQTQSAIAAVADDKQKPPTKPPPGETRKAKREREAAERKAKHAAAADSRTPPPKKPPVKTEPGTGAVCDAN